MPLKAEVLQLKPEAHLNMVDQSHSRQPSVALTREHWEHKFFSVCEALGYSSEEVPGKSPQGEE